MLPSRGAHVPPYCGTGYPEDGDEERWGQAGQGTPRPEIPHPAHAPERLATRLGTAGWMWHCRAVLAQAPRPAWWLPKHLPWLAAPTLAAARGSRAGAARGSEPGRRQHQHWVQGTGIPRAPSFHPKGEPPVLGHPSTRGVRGGASPHLWRAADFPRSTSTGGATSSDVELVSLAPLPPPLQLRGAMGEATAAIRRHPCRDWLRRL